jgi:phosphoglycerate dehydrogenase-like enzyme
LEAGANLKALIIPWAGLPESTRDLARDFPHIAVHNLHHNATSVAEMTAALMLAAAKFIVPMDRSLRAHDWTPRYEDNPAIQLHGRTALILGYGAIGRRVARICRGLGMRVLATRRHPERGGEEGVELHPPEALRALLPRAGVLVVALPQTPETEGLIGAAELALLPEDAVLVNVARGPIVDEGALYRALAEGRLGAAGIDVWYNYPGGRGEGYGQARTRSDTPPSRFPFHELDNVVMSPHRAGGLHTEETERARMEGLASLLNAVAQGEEMPNRMDVEAGY